MEANQIAQEELAKSLVALIDETLEEIEELKKSSKFSASEIKIEGPGEGIAGKPVNGSLEAKKAEKEESDEDEEDEEKKKKEAKKIEKAEDEESEEDEEKEEKDEKKVEKGVNEEKEVKKSEDAPKMEELMKSYMDSRINPLENKINDLVSLVSKLADAPVERKSVPAGIQPLKKSEDAVKTLSKSDVANKLFELKKSGTKVDSLDLCKVETGSMADVGFVANKYGIK
jgi:hypothetical protein